MNNQPISRWQSVIAFASIAKISSFLKVSMMLGSYTACFSAINVVMPTSGKWCGKKGVTGVFMIGVFLRMLFHGFYLPLHFLAYHIPGLFGAYYFTSRSVFIRVLVPLFCIAFFVLHPVGLQSWAYAMYWLIPIVLYFSSSKSLWIEALGSTLVAHAVGSVIWIYTLETSATMWISLIPIVAIERILFTIGIVALHKSLCWFSNNVVVPSVRTA